MTWKETLILHKAYFEKGEAIAGKFKPLMYMLGGYFVLTENVFAILALAVFYSASNWVVGYWWDKAGLYLVETEFGNKRNLFVHEMRENFKKKKKRVELDTWG